MIPHEAMFWKKEDDDTVRCSLCSHFCKINKGSFGVCGMRENMEARLRTYAYGEVIARNVDPIEKKPLYHVFPGSFSYSIATLGCNFKCSFCQNWSISQGSAKTKNIKSVRMAPEEIVAQAKLNGCRSISYTYTEPTIFFEYAYDISRLAKKENIANIFVTNGFMTEDVIEHISPYLNAANVDLKFFSDASYKSLCNGRLRPVLNSIKKMREKKIWVEITTLVIPGENDSDGELADIADFIASVDKTIPWHISRFHPDYKYTKEDVTPVDTIERAERIGKEKGLFYVYPGNVSAPADTFCKKCGGVLIERSGYSVNIRDGLGPNGVCVKCGAILDGIF